MSDEKYQRPAEVFHPGVYLLDELNERNWTQIEFARMINRPVAVVNRIINGKTSITATTALEIAETLGTTPHLWMNLDTAYKLWKASEK